MNAKLTVTVLIAFILVFSSLMYFGEWYSTLFDNYKWQSDFYNQSFEPGPKRVILLGSSYVGQINITHVDEYLSKHGKDYEAYNLATSNDVPKKQIKWLPQILNLDPKVVVIGLGYRDFGVDDLPWLSTLGTSPTEKPESFLPDPQQVFSDLFQLELIFGYDFDYIKNPKFSTLNAIAKIRDGPNEYSDLIFAPNTPFFPYGKNEQILTTEELANNLNDKPILKYRGIVPPEKNVNLVALKKMISKFQENNVKVIIFTVPHSKYHLDTIPETDKEIFYSMLNELSSEFNLEIHHLQKKYHGLEIWKNVTHIAHHKDSLVYSEDVAEIILQNQS